MAEEEKSLTPEEMEELFKLAGTATAPEEKHNVHSFLTKVVENEDTTKIGNLSEEELGMPKLPVRSQQELALFAEATGQPFLAKFFKDEAEITLATSLSKEGKLIDLAVINRREVGDVTKRKPNRGWFGMRKKEE